MIPPLERITRAAIRCFRDQGIADTRIADVARVAKMRRPNVYRYVRNMEELVRLVVLQRAAFILLQLKVREGLWYESLIDLFVQQVKVAVSDDIFQIIVEEAGPIAAKLAIDDNSVRTSLEKVIRPIIEKGRAAGEIREGLSDDDILHWLHFLTWSLVRDPNIHRTADIKRMARKFIIGGLLTSGAVPIVA